MSGPQIRNDVQLAAERLADIQLQMRQVQNNLKESRMRLFIAHERQLALQEAITRLRSEMDEHRS